MLFRSRGLVVVVVGRGLVGEWIMVLTRRSILLTRFSSLSTLEETFVSSSLMPVSTFSFSSLTVSLISLPIDSRSVLFNGMLDAFLCLLLVIRSGLELGLVEEMELGESAFALCGE